VALKRNLETLELKCVKHWSDIEVEGAKDGNK
jgi:hypothetical protein